MIDTGASKKSTTGYGQYLAYQKSNTSAIIDTTQAGAVNVQFGLKDIDTLGVG
jgi:hypothetical protein